MSSKTAAPQERIISYIDGFNLYYGLKSKRLSKFYWLDINKLSASFLQPQQKLVGTKYFTARISGPRAKRARQSAYIEAVSTLPSVTVYEGHYLYKERKCRFCNKINRIPEEKMTDSAVATELCFDAWRDEFDVALIVSGDSDLVPPIRAVRRQFPTKKIIAIFPPNRVSNDMKNAATKWLKIWARQVKRCQMPHDVVRHDGYTLKRPPEWS